MKMSRTFKVPISGHALSFWFPISGHALRFWWASERPEYVYADVECDSSGHASDAPEPLTHQDLQCLYNMVAEMLDLTKP